MDFGAFVQLEEGVEGLIPISEMSWTQRIAHPKDILKAGDAVRVAVLAADANKRKISLSLKALGEDPWNGVEERYTPGAKVSGAVVRTADFGAFVQLEEGIEGLIHISELSDHRVRAVTDVVKQGEVIEVRILAVDPKKRRVSLSLKPSAEEQAEAEATAEAARPQKKRKKELRGGLAF
jgi:small subunit ribosomal protein S1